MSLVAFLTDLFEHGHVRVGAALRAPVTKPERPAVAKLSDEAKDAGIRLHALLASMAGIHGLAFEGTPPVFNVEAAAGAAMWLHDACYCLVNRQVSAEEVASLLGGWRIEPAGAAVHYSVDVVLRYLPDLIRLSRGLAENDPLNVELLRVGAAWPLSLASVRGVTDQAGRLDVVMCDDSLCRAYVGRVLASRNVDRLGDPRCHEIARAALGASRNLLGPEVARALWPPQLGQAGEGDVAIQNGETK